MPDKLLSDAWNEIVQRKTEKYGVHSWPRGNFACSFHYMFCYIFILIQHCSSNNWSIWLKGNQNKRYLTGLWSIYYKFFMKIISKILLWEKFQKYSFKNWRVGCHTFVHHIRTELSRSMKIAIDPEIAQKIWVNKDSVILYFGNSILVESTMRY